MSKDSMIEALEELHACQPAGHVEFRVERHVSIADLTRAGRFRLGSCDFLQPSISFPTIGNSQSSLTNSSDVVVLANPRLGAASTVPASSLCTRSCGQKRQALMPNEEARMMKLCCS